MIPILIPSYQPKASIITLIESLKSTIQTLIIVVDDGSDAASRDIFDALKDQGIHVIHHDHNQGKGAALKTGIGYILSLHEKVESVITCDGDFQHHPDDIKKVYDEALKDPKRLILGTRDFSLKHVPFKSRYGNRISALYVKMVTKKDIKDTQTGLRALPKDTLDLALDIKENRFDFEMRYLMAVAKLNITIDAVKIQTIYEDNNKGTHFHTFKDAYRIYRQFIMFLLVGVSSAIIDIGIFTILLNVLNFEKALLISLSTLTARIISGLYNFFMNKFVSFKAKKEGKKQFIGYLTLYILQLISSATLVYLLSFQFETLTYVKLIVDMLLFLLSYQIQKLFIFKK